jgi:ferredoxin-NADP reductase
MGDEASFRQLTITAIREEVPGFKTVAFAGGHGILFKAGQYLTLLHPRNENLRRSYSITASPVLEESLSIGVKRIANGSFSRWLVDEAQPGDFLKTIGAGGLFVLPEEIAEYRQLFFFAAGSGITPVFSIIKTALHRFAHLSLVLIYSNAAPSKTIFRKELQELEKKFHPRLQIVFLFSNAMQLDKARLHRDLLLQLVSSLSVGVPGRNLYYVCGPEAYMRLCSYTLQENGIPKDHIKKENFVTENFKPRLVTPPDQETRMAAIRYGSRLYTIPVLYPLSILDAALQQGLQLPYSCKAGRCGNCVARCTQGQVWHSYNEVLTEKDRAKGLILTCVAHPVGGDVTLTVDN